MKRNDNKFSLIQLLRDVASGLYGHDLLLFGVIIVVAFALANMISKARVDEEHSFILEVIGIFVIASFVILTMIYCTLDHINHRK